MLAGLRDAHRELQAPLTNRGILRVLAREGIARRPARLPVAAMTVSQYGRSAIVVDPDRIKDVRRETAILAEEYAHAKLHAGDPGEVTIHLSACTPDDPRELEADYVARALLAGPGIEVAYVTPVRPAPAPRRPVFVYPYPDPYGTPAAVATGRREPRYGGKNVMESRLDQAIRIAKRATWKGLPSPYRSAQSR